MLTPNLTEAGYLLGRDPGDDLAAVAARSWPSGTGAVVSLYGHIADPGRPLLAGGERRRRPRHLGQRRRARRHRRRACSRRGADPAQAACWGAFAHAVSGQRLAPRYGRIGFLARELVDEVAYTIATV